MAENNDIKKNQLKNLMEDVDNLKKTLNISRSEAKKHGRLLIDLQGKLDFYETSYHEITEKFNNVYFNKMEKMFSLKYPEDITKFSDKTTDIIEKTKETTIENNNFQEILDKRPKEKLEILGFLY